MVDKTWNYPSINDFRNWTGFDPFNLPPPTYHVWFRKQYADCVEKLKQTTVPLTTPTAFIDEQSRSEKSKMVRLEKEDEYYNRIARSYPVRSCV
jgi:hypothetical protein